MTSNIGRVYLVGAGPGDPGLLTLKGLDCLRRADLILYDGLVNPLLLRHTQAHAERTSRSPGPHGRTLDQNQINQQMIAAAYQGKTVVRLKGGDPFIFGRGSEEAAALASARIPFEIVPGITAATAAAEYAGISLTHRQLSSAVAFVTGHEDPTKPESALDYRALAAFPGTLVFYMGLHRLETIVDTLIAAGKPAATPAAVVCRATNPTQQTVFAPLDKLASTVREANLIPPSLIIIGECVGTRDPIDWFEKRPLLGKTIGITRPERQAGGAIARALELGAQPVLLPAISIHPPEDWSAADAVLDRLDEFDWLIFTSVNGVEGLLGRLWKTGGDMRRLGRAKLATIGSSTADALTAYSLKADVVPDQFRAEALAEALVPLVRGKRALWARANRGRDVLPKTLEAAGCELEQVVVYRNLDAVDWPPATLAAIEAGEIDWIGLSSPSIASSFSQQISSAARAALGETVRLASISPVTTAAAKKEGLPIAAEATVFTWDGIFDAIVRAD